MHVNPKQRRRHSAEFKARVLAACAKPGASVAAVARSFGLNDNLVHQWRRGRGANPLGVAASTDAEPAPEFVALSLPQESPSSTPARAVSAATETIRIELKRGALGVSVVWPISAATDCAAWFRILAALSESV
jgi:transposase